MSLLQKQEAHLFGQDIFKNFGRIIYLAASVFTKMNGLRLRSVAGLIDEEDRILLAGFIQNNGLRLGRWVMVTRN